MRLEGQAKGGFYPTPPEIMPDIASKISFLRPIRNKESQWTNRILDPCCGNGYAVNDLAKSLRQISWGQPVETYGVEIHSDRAQEASARLDHVLSTDLFQASIANAAFNILFLNPPYDYDADDKRTEHAFLVQTTKYLASNGALIFIVPKRMLATSAEYLATYYRNFRCYYFPDGHRDAYDQVVLYATKRAVAAGNYSQNTEPREDRENINFHQLLSWSRGTPQPLYRQPRGMAPAIAATRPEHPVLRQEYRPVACNKRSQDQRAMGE